MEQVHKRAVASKLRNMAALPGKSEDSGPHPTCFKCKTKHKRGAKCSVEKSRKVDEHATVYSHFTPLRRLKSREELKAYITEAKKFSGNCPCCNKPHTFEREFDFGNGKEKSHVPSHRLDNCPNFRRLAPKDRGELVETQSLLELS